MKVFHCAPVVIVSIYEAAQDTVTAAVCVFILSGCVVASIPSTEIAFSVTCVIWPCDILGAWLFSYLEGLTLGAECRRWQTLTGWIRCLITGIRDWSLWVDSSSSAVHLSFSFVSKVLLTTIDPIPSMSRHSIKVWLLLAYSEVLRWFLVGIVVRALRERWVHIVTLELTLVIGIGVKLEACVRAKRLIVGWAKTACEYRVVRVAHNAFNLLEPEGTLSNVIACHQWIINHYSWLKEKVVFTVGILIQILLIALFSRHFAAYCILTEVKLGIVANKFKECLAQVSLGLKIRLLFLLQKRDDHEEECVRW